MKKVNRFFWWCAGANLDILEECPTDHSKFFGIGGTILFTALMASFAGGYAIFTAFQSAELAVFFGIFWGLLIFNLDRYIVSSLGKGDGTTKITTDEWKNAAPRLIMAILIGFVVATPLELKLFEKEIEVEKEKIINEKREQLSGGQSDRDKEIQSIKDRMAELNHELDNIKAGVKTDPRITLNDDKISSNSKEESDLVIKKNSISAKISEYQANFNFAMNKYQDQSLDGDERSSFLIKKNRAENQLEKLKPQLIQINSKLSEIRKTISDAEQGNTELRDTISVSITVTEQRVRNEMSKLSEQLNRVNDFRNADLNNYSNVAKQYNGFSARLEALDRLCNAKKTEIKSDNTIVETTYRTPVYWARLLISLMFILIEIAPVLFKMMTEAGPYDDRMDEIKYASDKRRKKFISDIDEKINTELSITTALNQNKINAEIAANEALLNQIAKAQSEIASIAIEEWRKLEIEKARNNPNSVINGSV